MARNCPSGHRVASSRQKGNETTLVGAIRPGQAGVVPSHPPVGAAPAIAQDQQEGRREASAGHPDRCIRQTRVEGLGILIWKTKPARVRVRWSGTCTIPCTCGLRALKNLGFSAGQKMAEGASYEAT
jgi:hypothetical protein